MIDAEHSAAPSVKRQSFVAFLIACSALFVGMALESFLPIEAAFVLIGSALVYAFRIRCPHCQHQIMVGRGPGNFFLWMTKDKCPDCGGEVQAAQKQIQAAMAQYEHNGALFLAALCLTVVAWFYGAPLWTQTFLLENNFDLNEGWSIALFAAFSGYDFLVAFVMGGGLAYFLQSARPLHWTIAFGAVLCFGRAAILTPEVPDADDWIDYAIFLAGLVVPLVGAAFGGVLAMSLHSKAHGDAVA